MSIIAAIAFNNSKHIGRALRQILVHIGNESSARTGSNCRIVLALKTNCRAGLGVHASSAERTCHVRRVNLDPIFQLQETAKDTLVQCSGPLLTGDGQVWSRHVADKE